MSSSHRVYITTFTPFGSSEADKKCPQCNRFLKASSFNSRKGKRNGIEGTIRNSACLKCEGNVSRIRSSRVSTLMQDDIKILQHEIVSLKSEIEQITSAMYILSDKYEELRLRIRISPDKV